MKAVAVIVIAFCVFSATQLGAAQRGVSGRTGSAAASGLSGRASHAGNVHAGFGQHGLHQRFGSIRLSDREFLRHQRFFVLPHHFVHRGVIFHRRFGVHPGFFFGHRFIHVGPSSVVIWSYPFITSAYEPAWRGPIIRAPITEEEPPYQRPLITLMLRHRKELELTYEQVQGLERLRDDYQREAIRSEGELRIGEMELEALLKAEPVDVEKVKAKLEEVERLRVDLRFARVRTIEQGKALLSAEQREKLQSLLGAPQQLGLGTEPAPEYER